MLRIRSIFFGVLAYACPLIVNAALNPETGSFFFQYYGSDAYGASPQNWAIAQDRRGVMYFANTDGVLEFDGLSWRLIRLKGSPLVKSVAVDPTGTVFVGAQGDFGYLRPDTAGTMAFVSLLDKVPVDDRKFTDVWRILPSPEGVYFTTYARLFRLGKDGNIRIWRPASNFGRAFYVLNALYVKTQEQGLLRMTSDRLVPIAGAAPFRKLGVPDAVAVGDTALIATPERLFRLDAAEGIQPFTTTADAWFAKNLLYTVQVLAGGEIAAGTRNGGLVLLSPTGAADRFLSTANGLSDDYVTAIFADNQGGVWVAGNNGITRFNPGFSRFDASLGIEGDVQCMYRLGNSLYAGTLKGLFRMDAPPRFSRVAGIETSVWALQARGRDLLAATDTGMFLVSGGQATGMLRGKRVLSVSVSARDPETIYAAGPAGVLMLRHKGALWEQAAEFAPKGLEFLTVREGDDGLVWATEREAFWRVDFRKQPVQATRFGGDEDAPVGWKNISRLRGRMVFSTVKGLRRYSEQKRILERENALGLDFADGTRDVYDVMEDKAGDVWVTGARYHGLLRPEAGKYKWLPAPLSSTGIQEIYSAWLDDDGTTWAVGGKFVLYRWDPALSGDPDERFQVLARRAQVNGERDIYGGAGAVSPPRLPWGHNDLRFEFAAPFYEDPRAVEYQAWLEGNDRGWSPWSREAVKSYTHLPEGSYRFRVRARTPHGAVAEDSSLAFGVLPPWYRTWWAYAVYLVCGAFFVWGVVRLRTRQLEREKQQLETIVEERTVEIREQRDEIHAQERKSHSLLLNILPASVADELKATGSVQPVAFDNVTVCFTDFVGFTLSSEKLPPGELVDTLNEYFTAFDEIVARLGLEKLKTIGDSYMFASGLPAPRKSHAVDAVLAALEMVGVVERLAAKAGGTGWNIRVGLHSGPVVAGVVGTRKFAFDIWGNTVNFAARMESSGVPGKVNVSETTFRLIDGLIDCEPRGAVKIKEGRELPMFLAKGPVTAATAFDRRYHEEFGYELFGRNL